MNSRVRDNLELFHSSQEIYSKFLKNLLPLFLDVMKNIQIQMFDGDNQKIRNIVMEIFHRLPHLEPLIPYLKDIIKTCLSVIQSDTDENGILAIKVLLELNRGFRNELDSSLIQPLFDHVIGLYQALPKIIAECLNMPDKKNETDKKLLPSTKSLKLMTDFPLMIVSLFQLYPNISPAIKHLLPEMVKTFDIKFEAPDTSSDKRSLFVDFFSFQVKNASFITYALRIYPEPMKGYKDEIPRIVTDLLFRCPNEAVSSRKELLVIIRHMIDAHNSDIRPKFLEFIDKLLDDKVLIGTSRSSYEALRPLAYSTLADLIHHVRGKLSLSQISKAVTFYTRIMYDPTLQLSIQTMSAKLLVHLVESIFKLKGGDTSSGKLDQEKEIGRIILYNIMSSFVNKVKSLSKTIEKYSQEQSQTTEGVIEKEEIEEKTDDSIFDTKRLQDVNEESKSYKYCRLMVKTLILGLKNVIYVLLTENGQNTQSPRTKEELKLFICLFKYGLNCFPIFTLGPSPSPTEEKENLDAFCSLFPVLSTKIFQEIFKLQMPYLYEKILQNQIYITIPTHFLAHSQVANHFSEILLPFLIEKMDKMNGTGTEPNVLLRLFKLVFGSIVTFPTNENVLKPHLSSVVNLCLSHATQNKESTNFYLTLRALFRSIHSGKFEILLKEFMGLIPLIIEKLMDLLKGSFKSPIRDLYIELCLTLPAKLQILIPYLPTLIRPVLYALEGNNELVGLGIRNLDQWLESSKPENFEPILKPVMPELLIALFSHLKPSPYPHGMSAMKILAKLGGINRKYLTEPIVHEINENPDEALFIKMKFNNLKDPYDFPVDKFIKLARRVFYSAPDTHSREQSFDFLKACLITMINLDGDMTDFKIPEDISGIKSSKTSITIYSCNNFFDPHDIEGKNYLAKTQGKINAETMLFRKLLATMFIAIGDQKLKDRALPFVNGLCRHFALLMIAQCKHVPDPMRELNPDIFFDALVDVFSHEKSDTDKIAAEQTLEEFIRVMNTITVNKEYMLQFQVWEKLSSRLAHCCYQKEWYKKLGGCKGIYCLCKNLSSVWVRKHEIEFVKALLFIIKDSPSGMAVFTIEEAKNSLEMVVKTCHDPNDEKMKGKDNSKRNHDLLLVLVSELSSAHDAVRKTVQSLIKMVGEILGKSVTSLLEQFKNSLSQSIGVQRFKQLPAALQTGFCEAVTFFLSLDPPLLQLSDQILLIIEKALTIFTRQKDEAHQIVTDSEKRVQVSLKMACMRLLKEALNSSEMNSNPKNAKLRDKIVEVFFKLLSSVNTEILDIAKSGLSLFISSQRLPKDLLQNSLRPVLTNLGTYQKLNLPILQTLGHLLELCQSYFSVKLGEQLIEHLKVWTHPQKITHLEKHEIIPTAAIMIRLVSLLPPKDSAKFLPQLIQITIQLEKAWKNSLSEFAAFRKPLLDFLSLYPPETVIYFIGSKSKGIIGNIYKSEEFYSLFLSLIKMDESKLIRKAILESSENLLMSSFVISQIQNPTEDLKLDVNFKFVQIVRIFLKKEPDLLITNRFIVDELVRLWGTRNEFISNLRDPISYDSPQIQVPKLIIKCLINYCRSQKDEIDILFLMLGSFMNKQVTDFPFLREFYENEVTYYPADKKKLIIQKFLEIMKDNQSPIKLEAIQLLVIGPLQNSLKKNPPEEIFDDQMIDSLVKDLFVESKVEESYKIEIIQLATLIVRYLPHKLNPYLKDIMKFAYSHLKSEDTTKYCGAILSSYFIEKFETPEKVIVQVLTILLKANQTEGKVYVRQALDVLLPSLALRLHDQPNEIPKWIKIIRKSITDEGHGLIHLVHIWQTIARHPDLFYPFREIFCSQIINSLTRIALQNASAPVENKKLSVDLIDMIIEWENKRRREALSNQVTSIGEPEENSKKRKMAQIEPNKRTKVDETFSNPLDSFVVNSEMGEIMINFLLKLSHGEKRTEQGNSNVQLGKRCIETLKSALLLWTSPKINANVEDLIKIDKKTFDVNSPIVGLEMMKVLLDSKVNFPIMENPTTFFNSLTPYFQHIQATSILTSISDFIKSLFHRFPLTEENEKLTEFYNLLKKQINENIAKAEAVTEIEQTPANIYGYLFLLKTIVDSYPEGTSFYSHTIFKVFSKFVKEHITSTHTKVKQIQQQNQKAPQPKQNQSQPQLASQASTSNDLHLNSILILLELLCSIHNDFGIRKGFLTTITQMIDKTNEINSQIMQKVLHEVQKWILSNGSVHKLNTKEKIFFTSKLTAFEHNPISELRNSYYEFLLEIYSDNNILSEDVELREKIELSFMYGLKSDSLKTREKFLDLLNNRIGKTIFERLSYIFQSKHWEPLSDNFWIRHAVDFLFSVVSVDDLAQISKETAKLFSITQKDQSLDMKRDDMEIVDEKKASIGEGEDLRPKEITEDGIKILKEHQTFLDELKHQKVNDLLQPLRDLSRESVRFSYDIWVYFFSFAWSSLRHNEKEEIQKLITLLLSREYHSKQYIKYPNVIQAILEGISKSKSPINLSTEMLKFLGKSFKSWHIVIPILEEQLEKLLQNKQSDITEIENVSGALCEIYRVLSEDGMLTGIWRNLPFTEQSKTILSLEQHGLWVETQESLKDVIQSYNKGEIPKNQVTNSEMTLWEDHWLSTSKKLQQWDELTKYGKSSETSSLMLECFWQNSDWKSMKELFSKHTVSENQSLRIYQISTAIMEDRNKDALDYLLSATHLALQRWCALPSFTCNTHITYLHNFQQLLELHDSTRFLQEFSKLTVNDIKAFFGTWRDRIPNKWDDISNWNDILTWRHHFFLFMSKKTPSNPPQGTENHSEFCLNEAVWTINKFAKISRKHNLSSSSFSLLSESKKLLNQIKPETSESFVRIYELLNCYLKEEKYANAIETIDSDKAVPKLKQNHKLEIMRLKGEILEKQGKREESYKVFSNAVQQYHQDNRPITQSLPTIAKCLTSWAKLLDQLVTETDYQNMRYLEETLAAFMQGIRYGSNSARTYIPRLFWLLNHDDKENLAKLFEKSLADIPVWVWLPWIQNLISMISRKDNSSLEKISRSIIINIGKKYPQSVYYHMRSFYFEVREEVKGPSEQIQIDPNQPKIEPVPESPMQKVKKDSEELMGNLLNNYQSMVQETEALLKELCGRFKPEPEEELQRSLESLLRLAYKFNIKEPTPSPVYEYIKQIINCDQYFPKDETNSKMSVFLKDIKNEFFKDLTDHYKVLNELIIKIKKWLSIIQQRVNLLPNTLPLENLSRYLADFQGIEIEFPGQYLTIEDKEPYVEQHEKLLCFLPQIDVIRRNKVSSRRISIRSQTGKLYKFLLQSLSPLRSIGFSRSEERTWNFLLHFNRILDKDKIAHVKNIRLHWPTIIPLSQKMRFVHERPTYSSFEDIFYEYCLSHKMNIDTPFIKYWNNETQQLNIPKDILKSYIQNTCQTWNEFYQIRKQFSIQIGIFNVVSYLLNVTDRNLHKILLGKNTGDVFQFDLRPNFDINGSFTKDKEVVPFRLTPNMTNLISIFNMEGTLLNTMSITAKSLSDQKQRFINLLRIYLNDELTSWQNYKYGIIQIDYLSNSQLLKKKTNENVDTVISKLEYMSPKYVKKETLTQPLNQNISDLIQMATNPENLKKLPPTYMPWF